MTVPSILQKFAGFARRPHLPWLIRGRLELLSNRLAYARHGWAARGVARGDKGAPQGLKISISCGFHSTDGVKTGAMYAVASIASMLARRHQVEFVTFPSSGYNPLMERRVALVAHRSTDADLYICDTECEETVYEGIKGSGSPLIVTCHGFLHSLHSLTPERIARAVAYADHVHLVGPAQQESFGLEDERCTIIPNAAPGIRKARRTGAVGAVGNLDEPRKNAEETVRIGLASSATAVHLWSAGEDRWQDPRVVCHGWESDKRKIYDSFDVLVFMSREETFGLVVAEAMSAGIPCVLSSLPVFRELFGDCPGVVLIDSTNRSQAPAIVDDLLSRGASLKAPIQEFWEQHFSPEAVSRQWEELLTRVTTAPR